MASNPNNAEARLRSARRRRAIADLMAQGLYCQREIARRLKIPKSSVGRHVQRIEAEWQATTKAHAARARDRQLAGIQRRRLALWEAWERSMKDAESETTKTGGKGGPETTKTKRGQCGDPRYMTELRALDEQEAKLLGLFDDDAGKGDDPADLSRLPTEDLLAAAAEIQAAAERTSEGPAQ